MKKRLFSLICCILFLSIDLIACTSAIIGADMNPYGRPLLWKNRDTSAADNVIEYIPGEGQEFSYVALFNAKDKNLDEAWIGMNDHGFAVMNTASYNLKDDDVAPEDMDKEGFIMSGALKKCVTVDDFAAYLDSLPKPLGVEANFGVIDAYGNGAYFETDNYKYKRFDLKDAENHVLIRTNYSASGRPDEGFGFIREENAKHLLQPYIEARAIAPEVLTEELSRSFYHHLLKKDFVREGDRWIIDQDFIPRFTSTSSIVIEGCRPLQSDQSIDPESIKREYIMWSALGYPPCAEIFPVWVKPNGVPQALRGTGPEGRSPQCDLVLERKDEVFPLRKGNGNKYLNMDVLCNDKGTGISQVLKNKNLKKYRVTRATVGR